jgi:hypothetical protein
MFGLFKSKEQKAIDKFRKSDLGQRLVRHNADFFGPTAILYDYTQARSIYYNYVLNGINLLRRQRGMTRVHT